MESAVYRLAEYKIIEGTTGGLTWEAHFGFAAGHTGKCFRKGTILFIGPSEGERPGYLKRDFFDHLKQYPEWSKTKYYCRGLEVFHCSTGKPATEIEMHLWGLDQRVTHERGGILSEEADKPSNCISVRNGQKNGTFRLQKYEIARKRDDLVAWRTYAGPNIGRGGNGVILEDILFFGSGQNERFDLIKRQFLSHLERLPKWDQTRYFCPRLPLHDCNAGTQVQGVWKKRKSRSTRKSMTKANTAENGYKNRTRSNLRKSGPAEGRPMFFVACSRKCINCAAASMRVLIPLFFRYLILFCKELKGRWDSLKRKGLFRS